MVTISTVLTTPASIALVPLPPAPVLHRVHCRREAPVQGAGAARDLIKFLKSPAAVAVMKAQGMEPGLKDRVI